MQYKNGIQNKKYRIQNTVYGIRTNRGFTLLLAALVSSVVLALGVSIFEISRKQVTLSSIGRESQFAFYAADAGAECALYWDVRWNYFSAAPQTGSAVCDGQALVIDPNSRIIRNMSFQFEPDDKCAVVNVRKCADEENNCGGFPPDIHTVIHSDGYNVDCDSISTSPRALQRSVELRY